jgi:hypothetical protein
MSSLEFVKAKKITLKNDPRFNEKWLQNLIDGDPSILGLGELTVIDRERRQERAGRLDLLLSDPGQDRRFELELQLGQTDESHIMRCIEYWDIERRRYPAYEHVAVLVAEDVTGRFLNLLGLFAGTIPLVVLQCQALQVEQRIVIDFVKILDQRSLRRDDESDEKATPVDRTHWVKQASERSVSAADRMLRLINDVSGTACSLNYTRSYIGLSVDGRVSNFVIFVPRKKTLRVEVKVSDAEGWIEKATSTELEASGPNAWGRVILSLLPDEVEQHGKLLGELLKSAFEENHA